MNRVVVGVSPSPNLRATTSKVGSLKNASHKAGGGNVKIESRKLDWTTAPRTLAVNAGYTPGGGDKKVGSLSSFQPLPISLNTSPQTVQ